MEEIRPPYAEGQELWQPRNGCRFGLRGMLLFVLACAVGLALLRVLPEMLVLVGIVFVALLSILSFVLFGIRD